MLLTAHLFARQGSYACTPVGISSACTAAPRAHRKWSRWQHRAAALGSPALQASGTPGALSIRVVKHTHTYNPLPCRRSRARCVRLIRHHSTLECAAALPVSLFHLAVTRRVFDCSRCEVQSERKQYHFITLANIHQARSCSAHEKIARLLH